MNQETGCPMVPQARRGVVC